MKNKNITINKLLILFVLVVDSYSVKSEEQWVGVQASFREVIITGFTRARHSMVLASEVDGKVARIYADIGDVISQQGQFACLDDTFVKLDIESTANEIDQHEIDSHYFKKQVDRFQSLVGKNSAAITQLDNVQRQLRNSQILVQIKQLKKQRLTETQLRHCIKSPKGWIVVERYIEQGQWVNKGDSIAKVGDYSSLLVPLTLTMKELKALSDKQHNLRVNLAQFDLQVPVTVEHISPAFDEASRKTKVNLLIKQKLPLQQGGVRVELDLNLPDLNNTFLIDAKALDRRFEEVWVKREDDQAINVEWLGNTNTGMARIRSPHIKSSDRFKIFRR